MWSSLLGGIDVKDNGYTLKGITIFNKISYSKRLSGEDFKKAYNLHYQAHLDLGSSLPQRWIVSKESRDVNFPYGHTTRKNGINDAF